MKCIPDKEKLCKIYIILHSNDKKSNNPISKCEKYLNRLLTKKDKKQPISTYKAEKEKEHPKSSQDCYYPGNNH